MVFAMIFFLSALSEPWRRAEPAALGTTGPLSAEDAQALVEFLRANLPELAEELANLAGLSASSQERAVNSLPFGTRLLLEAYSVVEADEDRERHLTLTSAGTDLIDAAVIASIEAMTPAERAML